MPGRDVSIPALAREHRSRGLVLACVVAAVVLLAIGTAIGSRGDTSNEAAPPTTITSSPPDTHKRPGPGRPTAQPTARTRAGAIEAAVRSITAFDGDVLLKPVRLRAVVARIAARASRLQLIAAFDQASAQTRAQLGADTVPKPVILLRSVPVGYRVERFSLDESTIAVWYVGIVGSGATVDPQQSWRTQVVSLVWERGAWKVNSFESSPGPTPALSSADVAQAPGELFTAIPRFEEFQHAAR
jgi:hypothetical protein